MIACGPAGCAAVSPVTRVHGDIDDVVVQHRGVQQGSSRLCRRRHGATGQEHSRPNRFYNTAEFVSWLTATLDALCLDRASLIGMSFGGWLALNLAVAVPTAGPSHTRTVVTGGLLPMVKQFTVRGMLMVFLPTHLTVNSFFRWPWIHRSRVREHAQLIYLGLKHFRMPIETARIGQAVVSDEALRTLHVPTLLLIGDHEVISDPRKALHRARRLIPDFRGELVPRSRHEMCVRQHRIVNVRVLEFLDESRRHLSECVRCLRVRDGGTPGSGSCFLVFVVSLPMFTRRRVDFRSPRRRRDGLFLITRAVTESLAHAIQRG